MTTFVKGRTVETAEPVVVVDAGLSVGTHRFQLVVVSNDGRRSAPEAVDVVVSRPLVVETPPRPTLIRPTRAPAEVRKTRAPKPAKPAKSRSET
ncbi:MAG: hypothetical protein CRU78_11675 [Candidatus Accumulibacter phosphatis]|uniref:Uncharacterized protein n=1 Tax=Candidatus Accumulibacter phosphatis TaxID=327160 RepID=A0A6A7RU77_9PROT|nr:hypothetical protein [Candidatus Accumulibacter phosphatis]